MKNKSVSSPTALGVELRDVSMRTLVRGDIVKSITAHIKPGSCSAITGPAGSGRTALLLAITGRFRIKSGSIKIGSTDMHESPAWIRRHTSVLLRSDSGDSDEGLRVSEEIQREIILGRSHGGHMHHSNHQELIDEVLKAWCSDIDPKSLLRDLSAWQLARLHIALGVIPEAGLIAIDSIGDGIPLDQQKQLWIWLTEWAQLKKITIIGTAIEVPVHLPANSTNIKLSNSEKVRKS